MNFSTQRVEQALERLGKELGEGGDIEILLVGGAAGMVTGLFGPGRVTTDCDVMDYTPPGAMAPVESAADRVAEALELASGWLNSDVQIQRDTLPDGWRSRRVLVGDYGRLRVWAASRPDLIAMKVLAGRAVDMEDLYAMRVRVDEVEFVQRYLESLLAKGTPQEQIEEARVLLESMETHDG